ncbi:MAG: helix-turn-helix transcriptional regulator [Micrococcaceae bacterium]
MSQELKIPLLDMTNLARVIRHARQQRGLSQIEIATELGVSQRFISELEQGKTKRLDDDFLFLLRRMGITLECSLNLDALPKENNG